MAVVYHEIYLPIDTESTFDYIVIKQGDAGTHRVRATLISNNRVYTIPTSGVSYYMKFRKPDNNYVLVQATVADNTISAEVTEEMLRVSGTGRGEFMIVSGSDELKTATFHVKIVKETFTSGDVQSHSDFAPFAALLEGAGAAASNANTAAAAANAAASLAEQKAQAIPDDYSDLVAEVAGKADQSNTYTKDQVDGLIEDVTVETDTTLAVSGAPADAAETGRQLGLINESLGTYAWHRKAYINLTTDPVVLTPTFNMGIDYLVADCAAGDVFTVTASGGVSSRAWGFLDSENHVLTVADANTQVEELELTAPTNAVKLVINNKFADGEGIAYKNGSYLISRVGSVEKAIDSLSATSEVQNNGIGIVLVSLLNKLGLTDPDSDDYLKNNILHLFREEPPVSNNDAYDCARYMYYNFNPYKIASGSKKNTVIIHRITDTNLNRVSHPPVLYNGETITTKPGYEMTVYELGDIELCSLYTISDYSESVTLGGFGHCQNSGATWGTQYSSASQSVKYIMMKFRKSDNSVFSVYEFTHMRGTVFEVTGTTKSAADYFAIEAGGYTPIGAYNPVGSEQRIIFNNSIGTKRCRSKIIPVSKGRFIAKDGYLLTLYEMNEFGVFRIGYSENAKANGYPGYVKEAKIRDNCMFVALVFKKTDETDFSDSEITNAYGTVFEYEGGDEYDVI